MWRSGPIGSEWVDLGGTVNKARGSSLVPKRKESPTDQGRAFLGIFMMRMRRHHEFMCVSLTCTDHLFGKHSCVCVCVCVCVCRAGMSCSSPGVCDVVFADSVASPQSNMGFCVHSAVFLLCGQSNRWRVVERHKEAKTHSLSSSQLATRSKRFSQACAQTCAISDILDFISFLFCPYAFLSGLCTFKIWACAHSLCLLFL